jgi:hypothetical protein
MSIFENEEAIEVVIVLPARVKEELDLMAWASGRKRSDVLSELVEEGGRGLPGSRGAMAATDKQPRLRQLSLLDGAA